MPKIPVDQCPAGLAMDAAVAEALGHVVEISQGTAFRREIVHYVGNVTSDDERRKYDWVVVPSYSTDIAAAWGLWRQLAKGGTWSLEFSNDGDGWCEAILYGDEQLFRGEGDGGDDEAATICRAFLKANGVEYVEYE